MAVVQKRRETAWVREVVTTAGDSERESRSRLFNGMEALGVMLFVLVNLWVVSYLAGRMGGVRGAEGLSAGLLTMGAIYLLFVAPFIHRDTLNSWGLGNPRVLWRMLTSGPVGKRAGLAAVVLALVGLGAYRRRRRSA